MTLFRSSENLFTGAVNFLDNSDEVVLMSPYIRLDQLKNLDKKQKINQIIVRWEVKDFHLGIAEFELYHYCQQNHITLFRNTRIHLKCLWNEKDDIYFGSANITRRGIGETSDYNFELNSSKKSIQFIDLLYLNRIIKQSDLITTKLFEELKLVVGKINAPRYKYPQLKRTNQKIDYYLISQLPMYIDINHIHQKIQIIDQQDEQTKRCISHDVINFDLDISMSEKEFYKDLKVKFNAHPFIIDLKNEIKNSPRKSLNYGRVVNWIKQNTTTVPTPISWELKQEKVVNILYQWICYFDKDFYWDTPHHSQVIYFKTNKRSQILRRVK